MIKAISQTNFDPRSYNSKAQVGFGQSFEQNNDEFVSKKPQREEKSFLQKHWGKILIIGALIIGAVALKGKFSKAKNEIKSKSQEPPKKTGFKDEKPKNSEIKEDDINKSEEAIADALKAVELAPKDRDFAIFKRRIVPKSADSFITIAQAFARKGNYEEALKHYTNAINLGTKDPTVYTNRGFLFEKAGETEKAIADYAKAIKISPKNPIAYSNRSVLLTEKGQYAEALEDINKSIKLSPKDPDYYLVRGSLYKQMGLETEAKRDKETFIALGGIVR